MDKRKIDLPSVGFGFYMIAAAFTLVLFFATLIMGKDVPKQPDFTDGWYYDENMSTPADLKHPVLDGGSCTFYAALPDDIERGSSLWFKCKSAFITVSVGGRELFATDTDPNAYLYGKTPGTDWVCVPLESGDAGQIVCITFKTNYRDGSAYISEMCLGDTLSEVRTTFGGVSYGTALCMLMMFIGAIIIIVYIAIVHFLEKKPKEFLYIGFFMLFTSIWSMSELRVMQIFSVKYAGIYHNITCMSMTLIPMPLILHFRKELDRLCRYIIPVLVGLSLANIFLCNILHFSGIADFHQTLHLTHIVIAVGAGFVVYGNIVRAWRDPNRQKSDIPPAICLALVTICGVGDVILYNKGVFKDSSFLTRIAMFFYAISLSISSLLYFIRLMRAGMMTDVVSRMAYEDVLTGLGNRTSYTEYLESLKELSGRTACVFLFDVNNLKPINDTYGHEAGDAMLKATADIISSVFKKVGRCYRIGGDEFACITDRMVDASFLAREFFAKIDEYNADENMTYHLAVALGYEIAQGSTDIHEAVATADHRMYQNKAEQKAHPAESKS